MRVWFTFAVVRIRQPERIAAVFFQPLFIDFVHVEWRICHYEIEFSQTSMNIFVVEVAVTNITGKAVDRKVHLAEPDGLGDLLLAIDRDIGYVLAVAFHERRRLDKQTAGTTGGVEDAAVKRLDHFHNQLDEAGGREELTAFLAFGHRELAEEIFGDLCRTRRLRCPSARR